MFEADFQIGKPAIKKTIFLASCYCVYARGSETTDVGCRS